MRTGRQRGFTMIEVLVVMVIVAIASVSVTLALRDSSQTQLEREAERLAALLESARAEARVAGIPVRWRPLEDGSGFRFEGLPERIQLPRQWLGEDMHAQVEGAPSLLLGPEPLIPAQALRLRHGSYTVRISSDGLAAFAVEPATQEP